MDKENKGACNALQQLCVAAASASAAEAAATEGRVASTADPEADAAEQAHSQRSTQVDASDSMADAHGTGDEATHEGTEQDADEGTGYAGEDNRWARVVSVVVWLYACVRVYAAPLERPPGWAYPWACAPPPAKHLVRLGARCGHLSMNKTPLTPQPNQVFNHGAVSQKL